MAMGYSVIASHDTIGLFSGKTYGLGQLRSHFGIKVGGRETENDNDVDASGVQMKENWGFYSNMIHVVKRGQIVSFPWSIPENTSLEIFNSHTYGNIATGDVWVRLSGDNEAYKFQYTFPDGDIRYYLTTKNNTAMIHTGHDRCNSTEIERKLWANLIIAMKQRTTDTLAVDHGCIDEDAPEPPVCGCSVYAGAYYVQCSSDDAETLYDYRVEGYDDSGSVVGASYTAVNAASGVSYFVYHIDREETMLVDDLLSKTLRITPGEKITGKYSRNEYLHIIAVDGTGNPSEVTNLAFSECHVVTDVFESDLSIQRRLSVFVFPCIYLTRC